MSKDEKKPDAGQDQTVEDEQEPQTGPLITVSVDGHDYTVEEAARDDFELLEDFAEHWRTGAAARLPSIMRRLLGDKQAGQALDRLRDPDTGRVSIDAGSTFVKQLVDGLDPN